jgi:metallo-beta-lactamase family protein
VVVPSFAVGRAQALLYCVRVLKDTQRIPNIPVFLNSPMAANVTRVFHAYMGEHRLTEEQCRQMCTAATIVNSVEESRRLNTRHMPMVIISASGMATGGRVLHHIRAFGPDHRNTILFAGFQAGGTRGAALVRGATEIKIHGQYVPIRAEVDNREQLSAHADRDGLRKWLGAAASAPRRVFVTHGEPEAADALRKSIEERLGWSAEVPEHGASWELE